MLQGSRIWQSNCAGSDSKRRALVVCACVCWLSRLTRMLRPNAVPRNWLTSFAGRCDPSLLPCSCLGPCPPVLSEPSRPADDTLRYLANVL